MRTILRLWIPDNRLAISGMTRAKAARHEPLRRPARPPRLRAEPQRQAAADDRVFPRDARSGARLCACCDYRRTLVPPRQARHHPRADRRACRSGAVRALVGLCGRPVGNGRADVAGARGRARAVPPRGGGGGGERRSKSSRTTRTPAPNPSPQGGGEQAELVANAPTLTHVVITLASLGKSELPAQLAAWLDALDETGRWALLKLVTGALRIGVSARLAKTAVARIGGKEPDEVELLWPTLVPPYTELFAWIEGRAEKPVTVDPAPFRPVMLSHAIEQQDLPALDPSHFAAEWKWDGIRVQAAAGDHDGKRVARLYSRTGEDISRSFPDRKRTR